MGASYSSAGYGTVIGELIGEWKSNPIASKQCETTQVHSLEAVMVVCQRPWRILCVFLELATPTTAFGAVFHHHHCLLRPQLTSSARYSAKDVNNEKVPLGDDAQKFIRRNQHWIILVDDEASIRQSVGDFLFAAGFQVTACADVAACQDVLRRKSRPDAMESSRRDTASQQLPSCIISDIRMPPEGANAGLHLLHWIRTNPSAWQRTPVVLLTAKGLTADRIVGYQTGADAYLAKPFVPEELLAVVDNVIARRREQKTSSLAEVQQELAAIKELLQPNVETKDTTTTARRNNDDDASSAPVYLTPAEKQVLDLLSQGLTNAEIATARSISTSRVSVVLQQLYRKTSTRNRTDLVRWALQHGYVDPTFSSSSM